MHIKIYDIPVVYSRVKVDLLKMKMIELSNKAKTDLREILIKELGLDFVKSLDKNSLNKLGNLLLKIQSVSVKKRINTNLLK